MKKEDLTLAYKPALVERRLIFSLGYVRPTMKYVVRRSQPGDALDGKRTRFLLFSDDAREGEAACFYLFPDNAPDGECTRLSLFSDDTTDGDSSCFFLFSDETIDGERTRLSLFSDDTTDGDSSCLFLLSDEDQDLFLKH